MIQRTRSLVATLMSLCVAYFANEELRIQVSRCVGSAAAPLIEQEVEPDASGERIRWERLAPLPDEVGFAGAYCGVSRDALVVAGGANFPAGLPWEGGAKIWHDRIFVLTELQGAWVEVSQRLPRPMAYGVSATWKDRVLIVGGGDADEHFRTVLSVSWNGERIELTEWPPLPMPLAFMAGCVVDDSLFVSGGIEQPDSTIASKQMWRLPLVGLDQGNTAEWERCPDIEGDGRMLHLMGSDGQNVLVVSGVALEADAQQAPVRVMPYLRDAYSFSLDSETWQRLPDTPYAVAAAATPMPALPLGSGEPNRAMLVAIGGDDGAQVGNPPQTHRGFPRRVLGWNAERQHWVIVGQIPRNASRVTLPVARWHSRWILPSGEKHPGIRSPDVWTLQGR